jgi:hypothetical protein
MQARASELRRNPLPRTWVNKGLVAPRGRCFGVALLYAPADHSHERLYDSRAKLRAGVLLKFFQRQVHLQRLAVGAVGSLGMEGVADEDDPANQEDLFSFEPVGVSLPVHAIGLRQQEWAEDPDVEELRPSSFPRDNPTL